MGLFILKKIGGTNNFSVQFIKIVSLYKKIGHNINVLQQTACLVVKPIAVDNFASLFNYTPAGRILDSMMHLLLGQPGFNCLISFALVFSCMYIWVIIFVLHPFCIFIHMY